MRDFKYLILKYDSKNESGVLRARDREEAIEKLQAFGYVLNVEEALAAAPARTGRFCHLGPWSRYRGG